MLWTTETNPLRKGKMVLKYVRSHGIQLCYYAQKSYEIKFNHYTTPCETETYCTPRPEWPCIVMKRVWLEGQARISKSMYSFLSVYEMASIFSARCARGPLLKKNVVKPLNTIGVHRFWSKHVWLSRMPNSKKRVSFLKRVSLTPDPKTKKRV